MLLSRTAATGTPPVTLAEARNAARIDDSDDDMAVSAMIDAAARIVGEMAGRVISAETWAASFPAGRSGDLMLPKSPVQSLDSISYFDAADVQQAANVADFYLFKDDDRAYLRPKASWPAANSVRDDAITVTFTAGYTEPPPNLKQAILKMVTHLYDHRGAASEGQLREVPFGVRQMVDLDRLGWIGS